MDPVPSCYFATAPPAMLLAHTAIALFRDISASHDMSVVKRDGNSGTGLALCMSLSLAPSWMGRFALSALL